MLGIWGIGEKKEQGSISSFRIKTCIGLGWRVSILRQLVRPGQAACGPCVGAWQGLAGRGFLRLPVGGRRAADRLLEVDAEEGLVGEIQHVGDLLYRILPAFEQGLGLENHVVADPLPGVAPADGMDHLREVFRCQAEPVGVEPDAALGGVVLPQLFEKAVENLLFCASLAGGPAPRPGAPSVGIYHRRAPADSPSEYGA